MPDQPPAQELKRREGSPNPDSKTDYRFRRRLALCLDGTWNERDSGTNVYHLSNLILEGKIEPEPAGAEGSATAPSSTPEAHEGSPEARVDNTWVQMVYYDEGVGTGFLDSVTGGAFGIGLAQNVREAYDWLVERYRDGDEVYIFGFSRGSYTARSLVGLIANCGLLYRGAPLPPEQLWNGYQKMTTYPEPRYPDGTPVPTRRWWQPYGQKRGPFRPLKYLKPDPSPQPSSNPWVVKKEDLTETENLLCAWSRRIPIQCLAIFDTVRTLGIEALAIPWLRDRKTEFHKTQLTWLIRHGFHALAIDEHRANFSHVPWHRKTVLHTKTTEDRADKSGGIQQRWFVGAHSNIGGSYDNGTLAQLPLAWFIHECQSLGLVFKRQLAGEPDVRRSIRQKHLFPLLPVKDPATGKRTPGRVRDSYTELGGGLWRHFIRAKRHYRRIAPPPEFQEGDEVISLHEELDESVLKLIGLNAVRADKHNYNPPNLYEYRTRPKSSDPFSAREKSGIPEPPKIPESPDDPESPPIPAPPEPIAKPGHNYCETRGAKVAIGFWLAGIALCGEWIACAAVGWKWHWLHFLPLVFGVAAFVVDRVESFFTHERALSSDYEKVERLDGWLDLFLNLRLIFVGTFVVGAGWGVRLLWAGAGFSFYPVPFAETLWLIAFCVMLIHFNASRAWAAHPMRQAGFGSIVQLQDASTPEQVRALRDAWMRLRLRPSDGSKSSEEKLKDYHEAKPYRLLPVHRTIWRDRIGFIPAYAFTFFAGLWVTLSLLPQPSWFNCDSPPILGLVPPCWPNWVLPLVIVLIGVVADYVEDAIHIRYLRVNATAPGSPTGESVPSSTLVWWARRMTNIKMVFGSIGLAGLFVALSVLGLLQVAHAEAYAGAKNLEAYKASYSHWPALTVPAPVNFLLAVLAVYLAYAAIAAFLKPEPPIRSR
jgi:uncharacterized protein (DUF2235 family)